MREPRTDARVPTIEEVLRLQMEISDAHLQDVVRRAARGERMAGLLEELQAELRTILQSMGAGCRELRRRGRRLAAQQAELDRERAGFLEFREASPLPFLSTDKAGRVCDVNRATENLLQKARDGLIGRWIGSLLPESLQARFRERLDSIVQDGGPGLIRLPLHSPTHGRLMVLAHVTVLRSPAGRVRNVQWVLTSTITGEIPGFVPARTIAGASTGAALAQVREDRTAASAPAVRQPVRSRIAAGKPSRRRPRET